MSKTKTKTSWYVAGLHFGCHGCGACCSGPDEGYIWVTKPEVERIAEFLQIPIGELRRTYLVRIGFRTTIIEQPNTKDCIFLRETSGQKKCLIYPVRPCQCRNWPFWPGNLSSPSAWNKAAQKCPGINHGRLFTYEEIEKTRKNKHWWDDGK